MLRYLSTGSRWFGRQPMYVHQRANWEFMAVLAGECAPVFEPPEPQTLTSSRMWIFPPETAHGWTGHPRRTCRVAVFHFSRVPELLDHYVRPRGRLELSLDQNQSRLIDQLAESLTPHYQRITKKSLLYYEHAMLELTMLALDSVPLVGTEMQSHIALHKVESCIIWYLEHMAQRPKLEEIAEAVHLSSRHLRRLFQEVHNCSPQLFMTRLRVQRASELLSQTDEKLEIIAQKCGFASSSDFSRVFKQHHLTTPETWRRTRLREPAE